MKSAAKVLCEPKPCKTEKRVRAESENFLRHCHATAGRARVTGNNHQLTLFKAASFATPWGVDGRTSTCTIFRRSVSRAPGPRASILSRAVQRIVCAFAPPGWWALIDRSPVEDSRHFENREESLLILGKNVIINPIGLLPLGANVSRRQDPEAIFKEFSITDMIEAGRLRVP